MHIQLRSSIRLLLLIAIAVMIMLIFLANRRERASSLPQQNNALERQKADMGKFKRNREALPQVNYISTESRVEPDSALRQARGERNNIGGVPLINMRESITEIARDKDSFLPPPALPGEESDLVIVGIVSSAKGYLSEDKSGAYSEYSLTVSEVLKGKVKLVGSQITAERFGAKVILPGGRVVVVWNTNNGVPQVGHRYVLFLRHDREGEDYPIITGYELVNGRVNSLDREETFTVFDGDEETAFLDLVRSSLK